ncbi:MULTISPECIES: hypothetical protein [Fictibacillus]|uniref:hypothetical protein n=1 Tax=Fictibacillus TaxID=1329200 RepID=UPI0018CD48B7|nr:MULTISPECIES: hypothetical protein [unclassified Fictibacillus]MBH0162245.1 hypothetical protein [Fictibacillus sp. 26RED30]MBH0164603.1 hypothetical protein [Fictibacillus sp. 7GRE50]MBH0175444.1 hypothetical protein [Fictibacillus sp. 23RED33]
MKKRKFLILFPPFVIIGFLLLLYLPKDLKPFSLLTALFFWTTYESWTLIEKKKKSS